MANHLAVPGTTEPMTRSRSSSSPLETRDVDKSQPAKRPARPVHTRSHSYMSPIFPRPKPAATFPAPEVPAETSRFPRLHLPGRHHHHHNNHQQSGTNQDSKPSHRTTTARHRYTQSEVQQYHKKRDSAFLKHESPATPTWTTTPPSSASEHPNDLLYPSSRGAAIPSLMRMASTRSHRGNNPGDGGAEHLAALRRRATSDPRSPTYDAAQAQLRAAHKSPIEIQLERADYLRRAAQENITEDDIKRKDSQLKAGRNELQERLANATRSASDLMRRLDDAQDTLSRTTEALMDTISSFSTLSDQSTRLVANFEHEQKHLDWEIRSRVSRFRNSICVNRSKRIESLEQRGKATGERAEDLGRRLENCRTIVKNWEQRETNKRRAWRGVWVGIGWGVLLITLAVLGGIASWKATEISTGGGTVKQLLRHTIVHNRSHGAGVLKDLDVPDDVRQILMDIDDRARNGRVVEELRATSPATVADTTDGRQDRGLRLLDEL